MTDLRIETQGEAAQELAAILAGMSAVASAHAELGAVDDDWRVEAVLEPECDVVPPAVLGVITNACRETPLSGIDEVTDRAMFAHKMVVVE